MRQRYLCQLSSERQGDVAFDLLITASGFVEGCLATVTAGPKGKAYCMKTATFAALVSVQKLHTAVAGEDCQVLDEM